MIFQPSSATGTRSSSATATGPKPKDSEPGYRPLQGRHDPQNPGADRCARPSRPLRSPARPSLRYRRRRSLIDHLAFGGFIADKAFNSNSLIADLKTRGAKIVISQHPPRASPADRRRPLQTVPPDRERSYWFTGDSGSIKSATRSLICSTVSTLLVPKRGMSEQGYAACGL